MYYYQVKSADKDNLQHTYISNFVAAVIKITKKNAIKFDDYFIEHIGLKILLPVKTYLSFCTKSYECRYCWYGTKCSLVDLCRISRQIF